MHLVMPCAISGVDEPRFVNKCKCFIQNNFYTHYLINISRHFVSAILFGLVERICPADPIPELSEIRQCKSDLDCDPRICCPDKPNASGQVKFYCRTAAADLDKLPGPAQMIVERTCVLIFNEFNLTHYYYWE